MSPSERVERLRKYLDEELERRERLQDLSREVVRFSARSIFALHRGEEEIAEGFLAKAREKLQEMSSLTERDPNLLASGLVRSAQQEYGEALLVKLLLKEGRLPEPEEVGIPYECYLMALADAAGELRRAVLDRLRKGEAQSAERLFNLMEEIYEFLVEFDYPDAVLPGMKRKLDVVRGMIERTRGELTVFWKK